MIYYTNNTVVERVQKILHKSFNNSTKKIIFIFFTCYVDVVHVLHVHVHVLCCRHGYPHVVYDSDVHLVCT